MNQIVQQGGEGALVAWDPNSGAALPAYLADALGEMGTNIPDRNTVPSLSYEGKTWTIIKDGNKTKLQAKNSDGDMVPVPVMRAVVLNFNADRGRAFYEGVYNPAASAAPKCWSADGKAPDASVKEKQSALCNGCPQSVKGSKVQEGKEMVACSSHRMLAIAPAFDLTTDPLRLKIAVTSDYDKEIVEHGWFAFRQYVDYLKSRGVTHTGLVVTKIKFDSNTAYPKLLFALDRVLSAEEVGLVKAAIANPKVQELLAEKWTAAGSNGTDKSEADLKPHGLEGAYADGWTAHPDSAGWSYKGQEVIQNEELAKRYPAPEPAAPPPPAVAAASPPAIPASQQVIDQTPPPVQVADTVVTPMVRPKPTDATHVAHAGTEHEVWWDGAAWVAPWLTAAPHATATAPVPPEVKAAPVVVDPVAALEADGWVKHPEAADYHYKGAEVVLTTELLSRYAAGNGAAPATPAAPAAPAASGQTATTAASPSDAAIPADVQDLLSKWSQ